jgi:hypothetical protein|tara:strand:- start:50721 stop:50864 length:144 start_codon:yes stop_codon:yes gene_type:complete
MKPPAIFLKTKLLVPTDFLLKAQYSSLKAQSSRQPFKQQVLELKTNF